MGQNFETYNNSQDGKYKAICELLEREINLGLPEAESKIWHRSPVWFLDGNPIVTYAKQKNYLVLMFWSGRSFDEPGLISKGSDRFQAAEVRYTRIDQVNLADVQRWLKKGRKIQWDYKNIVKNGGELKRLK